uniref:DUF19 domain-containing protein n=1 Tax=Caenorhabditis tropicalis TaxID=1561998 RepID=A0A1I7UW71_9PELO
MWKLCTILIYIFLTFLALLCITFALSVAYISAVIFLPTYFPTQIHKFSRTWDIEASLDLNDPSVKLSPWGLPYDSECGGIRMVFLDMDCMEPARKCQELIEEYEKEYGKTKKEKEEFLNIAKYCFDASRCMQEMACKEATYQFNRFNKNPHNFFLNYSNFSTCISQFYRVIRDDSFDNCTWNYPFLSVSYLCSCHLKSIIQKDPLIKNHAYSQGKLCFLSFANQFCDVEIVDYLENYYEFFLEFAMSPSIDDCGVFEKFEALGCKDSMDFFQKSKESLEMGNQTQKDYEIMGFECREVQNRIQNLTNPCGIPQEFQMKMNEFCEKMNFFSSPFWKCVQRMKSENIQPDLLLYPHFIGLQFGDDTDSCTIFREDSVKNIMIEYCGSEVIDGFEKEKSYLLKMWNCI